MCVCVCMCILSVRIAFKRYYLPTSCKSTKRKCVTLWCRWQTNVSGRSSQRMIIFYVCGVARSSSFPLYARFHYLLQRILKFSSSALAASQSYRFQYIHLHKYICSFSVPLFFFFFFPLTGAILKGPNLRKNVFDACVWMICVILVYGLVLSIWLAAACFRPGSDLVLDDVCNNH